MNDDSNYGRKPEGFPVLRAVFIAILLFLFIGGCQGVVNGGKPADTPRYTPRVNYTPRSTPGPTRSP